MLFRSDPRQPATRRTSRVRPRRTAPRQRRAGGQRRERHTRTAPVSSNSNTSFSVIDKLNYTNLSPKNKINKEEKNMKEKRKEIKKALKDDVPVGLLYVLCFFIPWVAVGLATNWDIETVVYNILWSLLCGIPGIIHAFIVVRNNS